MKYWDSSALLPLVVAESTTAAMQKLIAEDPVVLTWWGSRVEAASALARLAREELVSPAAHQAALDRLAQLAAAWSEVVPTDAVRSVAARLLRVHPLRAADALQLAAALVAAEHDPAAMPFVTLDRRLALAARQEGFAAEP